MDPLRASYIAPEDQYRWPRHPDEPPKESAPIVATTRRGNVMNKGNGGEGGGKCRVK